MTQTSNYDRRNLSLAAYTSGDGTFTPFKVADRNMFHFFHFFFPLAYAKLLLVGCLAWDTRIDVFDRSTLSLDWLLLTYLLATNPPVVHMYDYGCQTRSTTAVSVSTAETSCAGAPREAVSFLLGQARGSRSPGGCLRTTCPPGGQEW